MTDNVISSVTQIDKKMLMEKLSAELPALRAKMRISQAELG